jgi:uncharacterized protein (TIGR02246 family)
MRPRTVAASVLSLVLAGCVLDEPRSSEADTAAIREATDAMGVAMVAGDVAAVTAMFTADGAMYPPNEPAVVGSAAIEAWGTRMTSGVSMTAATITIDEVRVADDWAVSHGHWAATISMGEMTVTDTTKYMLLWERQADGRWQIAHDVWNSIRPLPME